MAKSPRMPLELVWPTVRHLPGYAAALQREWSPDNVRGAAAAREELERIRENPDEFLASQVDREASGPPIAMPDGSTVPRLPGYRRWLWDGEFCGVIGFRWRRGSNDLPPTCLGHVGFSVVPWKRRRGYATEALRLLLPDARAEGLDYLDITTDTDNRASQKVIETNGGVFIERFTTPAVYGSHAALRYRIALTEGAHASSLEEPL